MNYAHIRTVNASSLKNINRIRLSQFMLMNHLDILLMQETHWSSSDIVMYKNFYRNNLDLYIEPGKNNAREITIISNQNWKMEEIKIKDLCILHNITEWHKNGRFILCYTWIRDQKIIISNIYALNNKSHTSKFFNFIQKVLSKLDSPMVLGGDWNCILYANSQ